MLASVANNIRDMGIASACSSDSRRLRHVKTIRLEASPDCGVRHASTMPQMPENLREPKQTHEITNKASKIPLKARRIHK
ncbi:unnamed protein product [Phytophthora lilii]|uniref:Unnamed protein product n=1 Tax=Phytophthora lilii TaxID=2077276 RepID=A0A9W6XFD1_9STRA|nr:unnamed protein product [Phytophthora lilii]